MTRAITLFLTGLCCPLLLCAQNEVAPAKPAKVPGKLSVQFFTGATASLCSGDYIRYQKSVVPENSDYTSSSVRINPLFFFTAGFQAVYAPFNDRDKALSKLSFLLGAGYMRNGFTSVYNSKHRDPSLDISYETTYKEKFCFDQLMIPVTARYGKRFYAEIGYVRYLNMGAFRKKTVEQEASGSEAYLGGFNVTGTLRETLDKRVLNTPLSGFVLGAGTRFRHGISLRAQVHFSGKMLHWEQNFRAVNTQLQIIVPVHHFSF